MGNLGVATIDTADVYSFGGAEETLGEAVQGRRDEFVLVTKGFLRITPGLHDIGLSRAHIIRGQGSIFRHDYILLIARMRRTGVRPTFKPAGDFGFAGTSAMQFPDRRGLESRRPAAAQD